jgi:hypothetical protein
MLIRGEIPPYYNEAEIMHNTRNLYVNLENLDLQYYKKIIMQNNLYWQNVTDIFQRKIRDMDIIRTIQDSGTVLSREQEDVISGNFRAVEKIPSLTFIEQSIPVKASLKEAIDIFYIVNASGVNLTDAELALAQISGYWPKAREKFKVKLQALKKEGFIFKLDFIVYCLLGILHNMGSDMTKLHSPDNKKQLQEAWKKLDEEVLDYTINIMRSHAFVDHTKEINSVYALVPIIVFIYRQGSQKLSQKRIKKIIKWFYYSQIRQRYISQLPQKLDKDIGIVVRAENPFDELLNIIKLERSLEITPDEFVGVDIRNALFSLMRWYFKSKNAICFTTGIGIRKNMGAKYALEWDHIFPYSALREEGYGQHNRMKYALAQEITNRAILTASANRSKSDKPAVDYLKGVNSNFPNALKLQSIPKEKHLWELDNYEDFLHERRKMLSEELNTFLEKITTTEDSHIEVSIDEMVREGESAELEFKSSLRWSYQNEQVDKRLEQAVLKTIAAFSNGDGGTLLVGVNDDGEILGLDWDYTSLSGESDEFELHFRNLLNKSFDKVFTASNIAINIEKVNGHEICKVDISKGSKPVYLETFNKSGQKQEKFYVRSGNSSQELKLSEVSDFISSRFG